MSSSILTVSDASLTFTQALVSLATGSARQSTVVDNTVLRRPAANLYYVCRSGGVAPTAGGIIEIFLYRREDTTTTPASAAACVADDAAGIADAAITIENSQLVGSLVCTATTEKNFWGVFTTANLGVLGPAWGTSVRNSSGAALDNAEADHRKAYKTYYPQAQ